MKRIKMKRALVALAFLISLSDILFTFYKLTIEPIFTTYLPTLTFGGLALLIIDCIVLDSSFNYTKKELSTSINKGIR